MGGRHLDRLERSLRELTIAMPMRRAALMAVMREVMRRNLLKDGLIYLQVTRGAYRRDHASAQQRQCRHDQQSDEFAH